MTHHWNQICIELGDAVLDWTLLLPRDLTIVVVGAMLAVVLLLVRRTTVDRVLVQQIAADQRRLRELKKEAFAADDRESLNRNIRLRQLVAQRRAGTQIVPVCVSLVLLTAVMSWGRARLDYLPISPTESVRFVARFPAVLSGEVVHIVPMENATAVTGWVQTIQTAVERGIPRGHAEWTLQLNNPAHVSWIVIRLRNQSAIQPLRIGTPKYAPPIQSHNGGIETEVLLTPYRPLGFIPFRLWLGLPGWSLLLTLVTVTVYLLAKQLFTILE